MGSDFISADLDLESHVHPLWIRGGKFILFGSEVAELLHPMVHVLSSDDASSSPASLVASAPPTTHWKILCCLPFPRSQAMLVSGFGMFLLIHFNAFCAMKPPIV
ncbi:hypothetical protein BHE74_00015932 [Ensete ventricosum]|nr:hypothetical protein BHE74_00015932 [Ensete ventricosum]